MNDKIEIAPEAGDLRVWWIPQLPMKPFHVPVPDVKTAKLVLDCLARYDIFQFEHKVKPDYCNAGGLQRFDPDDIDPDEDCDGWTEWYDETTGDSIDEVELPKDGMALCSPLKHQGTDMSKISAPLAAAILAGFDAAASASTTCEMPIPTAIQAFLHVHGADVRQLLMDLSEPKSGTDPIAIDPMAMVEHIAEQWDGCQHDSVGEVIDIGQAIRTSGMRFITEGSRS